MIWENVLAMEMKAFAELKKQHKLALMEISYLNL